MTETLLTLLTRLSEAGDDTVLSGSLAQPYFGPEFDHFLRRRVLVELAPSVDWDVCPDCDCGMVARPIQKNGAGYRATCPMNPRDDVSLSSDDIRSFAIASPNLVQEIASAAGVSGTPARIARGMWFLGETDGRRAVCLALESTTLAVDGLVPIIRRATGANAATLLATDPPVTIRSSLTDAGIHVVEVAEILTAADPCACASVLEPSLGEPELIVSPESATIEWRGRRVTLSHQLFPVFQRLAERALSRDPIASGPYLEDTTGREAKDLMREIREALKSCGASKDEVSQLITAVRGRGYRLNLDAHEMEIRI